MKQTHLPKDSTQRTQLIKSLTQTLAELTKSLQSTPNRDIPSQIQILTLRLKLIADCAQLSVERITHLQQIFKHYCTHIFKIGKHMTFERLQYQKVHLTLDRFCVFLKDFTLTSTKIDEIQNQVIDKQQIVRSFKRISKNCRDLSFQEFIACLEKLAIIYYDEKQMYKIKRQKYKEERQARIMEYRRKMKIKKKQEQARRLKSLENKTHQDNQNDNQNQNQNGENEQNEQQNNQQNQQNNDLVQKMMEDDNIQHPNDEIKNQENNSGQVQNQFTETKANKSNYKSIINKNLPQYCHLTAQQKIQYFYQLISVDNVHDFRKKMSQLGLPLFKQYQSSVKVSHNPSRAKSNSQLLNVVIENDNQQDERRLIQLRQKLNIKKQRDKHLYSPALSKQQYEQRKKRREQKQMQLMKQANSGSRVQMQTSITQKERQKKKIQLMDKQLSLDMLNHIAFQDLKNKFDPRKYLHSDQTDQIYLNQYGIQIPSSSIAKNQRKNQTKSQLHQKTATTLQRKRTSSNIVQDFKKRAYQMQVKQFHKEAQLSRFVNQMKKKQKFRKQII